MNIENGNKDNSLVLAVQANDNKGVLDLLSLGVDPNCQYSEKHTILDLASSLGNTEIVKCLIASGAEVNSLKHPIYTWERYWSPLTSAIVFNQFTVVKILLEAGADIDCYYNINDRDETFIPQEVIEKLFYLDIVCSPLYLAITFENLQIIQTLLQAGANPDHGEMNNTPLSYASSNQNLSIVQMLIEAGADPNTDMEDYERAIMRAAAGGNLAIVKALVEAGAELDTVSQGESALSFAASRGHVEVYEYLYPLTSDEDREYAETMRRKALRKKSS
jgi:ankyrin repeat protein